MSVAATFNAAQAQKLGRELLESLHNFNMLDAPDSTEVLGLIAQGAALDEADVNGATPLIWACVSGRTEIVQALISAGADFDHRDKLSGATSLMLTIKADGIRPDQIIAIAQILIDAGADLTLRDRDGKSAQDRAWEKGYHELAGAMVGKEAVRLVKTAVAAEKKRQHEQWVAEGCPVDQDISMPTIRFEKKKPKTTP